MVQWPRKRNQMSMKGRKQLCSTLERQLIVMV